MFDMRRSAYYDSHGRDVNIGQKFLQKTNAIFGNNGTHAHLNNDKGMEMFLDRIKAPYQNTKMLKDLKTYVGNSLRFCWIKPYSTRPLP